MASRVCREVLIGISFSLIRGEFVLFIDCETGIPSLPGLYRSHVVILVNSDYYLTSHLNIFVGFMSNRLTLAFLFVCLFFVKRTERPTLRFLASTHHQLCIREKPYRKNMSNRSVFTKTHYAPPFLSHSLLCRLPLSYFCNISIMSCLKHTGSNSKKCKRAQISNMIAL